MSEILIDFLKPTLVKVIEHSFVEEKVE